MIRDWRARGAVAVGVAACATGLALGVADVRSPLRTALVPLFLFGAPTAAVAGLLRGFDPFARLIIAFATTIALLALTATLMLMAGVRSPAGGLLAVAGITAACVAAQLPPLRRKPRHENRAGDPPDQSRPRPATASAPGGAVEPSGRQP